jgi:hypothetical protein
MVSTFSVCLSTCRGTPPVPPPAPVNHTKQRGAWEGTGNTTIGFVSESGVFRINWKSRSTGAAGTGIFRLTVRSAISGRPIRIVADAEGDGSGTVDFVDDPRMYEFIVDAAGTSWSFSAEER